MHTAGSQKRTKKPRRTAPRATARVFWSGRSQAVRLPKEFRLETPIVEIHREGDRIVLSPVTTALDENGWPEGFWSSFGHVEDDFDLGDRLQPHERPDPFATPTPRQRGGRSTQRRR